MKKYLIRIHFVIFTISDNGFFFYIKIKKYIFNLYQTICYSRRVSGHIAQV